MDLVKSNKKRKMFFTLSSFLVITSILLIIFLKPKIGIDFAGGTLLEIHFNNDVTKENIITKIENLDYINNVIVQQTDNNQYLIRTNNLNKESLDKLNSSINSEIGEYTEIRMETVGPTISKDTTQKASWAIIIASIAIILYIAYAFRKVPKPASSWRFGVAAIVALIHDIIITIGIFVLFSYFFGFEIDSLFIVAMLTILGYSVNDTIIIFDRIRENLKAKSHILSFAEIVNQSLVQSVTRSLNTSITLILVLLSLLFLGGESIKPFISLLLIGAIIGTYSSIFLAPPLLIVWQEKIENKNKINSEK